MEALKDEIDFNNLSKKEAVELRFCKWSKEDPSLYLIPIWLLPVLPVGTKLTCINGDEIVYDGKNVDNDVRFGCLAAMDEETNAEAWNGNTSKRGENND